LHEVNLRGSLFVRVALATVISEVPNHFSGAAIDGECVIAAANLVFILAGVPSVSATQDGIVSMFSWMQ
jgi:hypothetical protein